MASITVDQLQVLITANAKDLDQKIDQVVNKINDVQGEASKTSKKSIVAFGAIAGAAQSLATKGIDLITSSIGDAVKRFDTLNNFPSVMANFGISADEARKMIDKLDKGVRGLPTSLNDIASLAEAFVPVTKNTKQATDVALAFNDAVLAGGAPTQVQAAALEQLRQALSKGKPDLQDWKTIESAMPAQLQQVTKELGIGTGNLAKYTQNGLGLYNAMQDGKVSMDDFNEAIVKLDKTGLEGFPSLQQQAKNATKGVATSVQNMKSAINRGITDIMKAIGKENIAGAITDIGKAFEQALKGVGNFLTGAIEVGKKIADFLRPAFEDLWGTIVDKFIPAIEQSYENLKPAITIIGGALVGALYGAIEAVSGILSVLSRFINIVTQNSTVLTALVGAVTGVLAVFALYKAGIIVWTALTTAYTAATVALSAVQALQAQGLGVLRAAWIALNIVMNASPIGLVITAVGALAGALAFLSFRTDDTKSKEDSLDEQRKRSIQIVKDLKDAENNLKDARFNLEGATLRVEQAQKNYNDAVDRYGAKSLEAREAAHDLKGAQMDLKDANDKVKDSTDKLTDAQEAQDQQIQNINQHLNDLNGKTFTYFLKGQEYVAKDYGGKNGTIITPTFATGGFTGTGGKNEIAGIVHKGEYVLPKELVDQNTGKPKAFDGGTLGDSQTNLTINIGGEKLTDVIIKGINGRSFLNGATVLNI